MYSMNFRNQQLGPKVNGFWYAWEYRPAAHRMRIETMDMVSAARTIDGSQLPVGEGNLQIAGPGSLLDEFNGITFEYQVPWVDRQRRQVRTVFQYQRNDVPAISMSIGNRRQVQPGALGDCLLKITAEQEEPIQLLGAGSLKRPKGSCALRFALLRRDDNTFMQHLAGIIAGPAPEAADMLVPFVVDFAGEQFPVTSQTIARIVVRQMAGIYMNAAYPSLDELVRTGGADPLVPLFNESALDLLSREERWELDDPIEHDIVEVADLVFAPGMVDPNKF